MFKKALPFFMIVETPLHAGSGTELGVVDLPIQRERHTGFPKIEASGLKGSIREVFEEKNEDKQSIFLVFGPEETEETHAGALGFTDARLLLFPVKSMKGIFAWVTCPQILERFRKDMNIAKISNGVQIPPAGTVPQGCTCTIGDSVILEEYTFRVKEDRSFGSFTNMLSSIAFPNDQSQYWRDKMTKDVIVLSDNDLADFVQLSTEVIARIKIDNDTGTVQSGALFYEEYLPQDSILYSLALASPVFSENKGQFAPEEGKQPEDKVLEFFKKGLPSIMQIGGNATIGKGIVRTQIWEQKNG